jgi:sec-independent protein translocase protein TatC
MASPADDEPQNKDAADLEDGRMPFLRHLAELRDRVRNAALFFIVGFLVCWYFSSEIFDWLCGPLIDMWNQHHGPGIPADQDWGPVTLIYTGLTQPFWVDMSVGLWAGIFVTSPFIFHQLWRFIAPGLYKRERKIGIVFAVFSAVFFVSGALFCFELALPKLYQFLLSYNKVASTAGPAIKSLPSIQEYLDLTKDMMLAFGAIFELPLLIYFLAMVGLVTHRSLWKFSRWFIVLAFIIGAVLTPGPDVVSQFMMATPMIVLYNISILFAWRVTKKREAKAAAEAGRVEDTDEEVD